MSDTLQSTEQHRHRYLQSALAAWFATAQRSLPWRRQRSLYRTVVSEFMLQQTRVDTVIPYFERWTEQFPDFATLAAADEAAVLHLWEGLGYYRRARNLRRLAQELEALPSIPRTATQWQQFPGVGPYTAAAITSLNFADPVAAVDGNVVRIMSRLLADPTPRKPDQAVRFWTGFANELLDRNNPGQHNEAMMELGATLCSKRAPQCGRCPLTSWCLASHNGDPESYPRLIRQKIKRVQTIRLWVVRNHCLLLHKRSTHSKRLADLAELPSQQDLPGIPYHPTPLLTRSRGISNQHITESVHHADYASLQQLVTGPQWLWVPFDQLSGTTLSGPHRRWIEQVIAQTSS